MLNYHTDKPIRLERTSDGNTFALVPSSQAVDLSEELTRLGFANQVEENAAEDEDDAEDLLHFGFGLTPAQTQAIQDAIDAIG